MLGLFTPPGIVAHTLLTPAMLNEVSAPYSRMCHLIAFQFSSGTLRLTTASVDIAWNNVMWTAIGGAMKFDAISETADLTAAQVNITVSGVDQGVIAALLNNFYVYRTVQVYRAAFDGTTGAIVADPVLIFQGLMNGGFQVKETRKEENQEAGTVEVVARCMSRVANLDQREGIQTNTISHDRLYPGDQYFSFVQQIANVPLVWSGTGK